MTQPYDKKKSKYKNAVAQAPVDKTYPNTCMDDPIRLRL